MGWKPYATGIALAFAIAGTAAAADYPFSGLFNYPPDEVSAPDAPLFCAYNFFTQEKDGAYTNYHLDLDQYRKDGTIRYLVFTRGKCSVDRNNVESCSSSWDANPQNVGQDFFDVIQSIKTDEIVIAFSDTKENAESYVATGEPKPSGVGRYVRCPFDEAAIAKYRTETESKISEEERSALMEPQLDNDTRDTMNAVLKTITGGH
ncbi:MAG TPA: hypothetical protein VFB16_11485 [Bauldia sp.]|nr:hypothetical protein [Bauldia sp.]